MTEERKSRFAVISNNEAPATQQLNTQQASNIGYHSNPMYQKLLNYKQVQEKKKFTVEDLLKWC